MEDSQMEEADWGCGGAGYEEEEKMTIDDGWGDFETDPALCMLPSLSDLAKKSTSVMDERAELIREGDISQKQQKLIASVVDTCGVSPIIARALLLKYQWNKETLTNRFFDEDLVLKFFNIDMSKKRV